MDADTHKIGHAPDLGKGSASRSQADRPCAVVHEERDYGAAVPWPQRLGNATAVSSRWTFLFMSFSALAGFLLSLSPLSCMLMGWRGSSSNGATATGMYMFGGGGLLWFGGLGEWLVGNTFASVVFFAFGAFWLNLGAALIPSFNAYGSYSPSAEDPDLGLLTVAYNSGWAKRANNQAS
ncbi:hypothetical protein G7054_g3947 [Neopestalotiopsis clavispora]|nr:hypothetical protein G7054_g3947 [Neopestalotiopsis clavispora]